MDNGNEYDDVDDAFSQQIKLLEEYLTLFKLFNTGNDNKFIQLLHIDVMSSHDGKLKFGKLEYYIILLQSF